MGIQITAPGSGYTYQPTISLSGTGVGSGAAVGLISSVTLASPTSIGGPGNMVINSAIGESSPGMGLTKVGAATTNTGEPPRLAAANSSASSAAGAPAARLRCSRLPRSPSRLPTTPKL